MSARECGMPQPAVGLLDLPGGDELPDPGGADDLPVQHHRRDHVAAQAVLGAVVLQPCSRAQALVAEAKIVPYHDPGRLRLKWRKTTLSMPKQRRMMSSRPMALLMSGTSLPKTSVSGCTSKLSTEGTAPISAARSLVRFSRAACPIWTPSKKPRAMTLFFSAMASNLEKAFDA